MPQNLTKQFLRPKNAVMAIWPVAVLLPSAFGATKTTKLISADKKTETLKSEAESAMQQIINKNYALELQNAGAEKIIKIGIAFQGKQVDIIWE